MPKTTSVLELVRTIEVSAVETFRALDFFKESNLPDAIVFWLDSTFEENYLKGAGKIETNIPARSLKITMLKEDVNDKIILAELGEEAALISLANIVELIKKQPKGEVGDLLVNGLPNIFYVKDQSDQIWAVFCRWDSDSKEWDVCAYSLADTRPWNAGNQIFSCDSQS